MNIASCRPCTSGSSFFSALARKDTSEQIFNENFVQSLIAACESLESNGAGKEETQRTINSTVDAAIESLVASLRDNNQGIIKLPNLNQSFSTGSSWWEATGDLNVHEGTFEDLTSIKRVEDAVFSRSGLKITVDSVFRLSIANMKYQKYKLRYGVVNLEGKILATVDGVALSVTASVNYNQKPCRVELQELRVSEFGKMKVRLTGLGPFNKPLSKHITWLTKKWQNEIVVQLEKDLKKYIDDFLKVQEFSCCESCRPIVLALNKR